MKNSADEVITLAITGASGSAYALRLLQSLMRAERKVYLMISDAGRIVMQTETGLTLPQELAECEQLLGERYAAAEGQLRLFALNDWFSPAASGSNAPDRMIICPCSGGTLSAIAMGSSDNLIERAADVMLKERKQLILVVRETPFSTIHLENMLKLSRMGVVIMPASPGFYHQPAGIEDLVDFMVARMLDHLEVQLELSPRWGQSVAE